MSDKEEGKSKSKATSARVKLLLLSLTGAAIPAVADAGQVVTPKVPVAHVNVQQHRATPQGSTLSGTQLKSISGAGKQGHEGWLQ
jgi:hypothetical protein